ncbi:hypothetical protein HY11_11485 [Hyphomonas pacifica]|nr:hypothetical protein HY11_11485 [Hyphomonas pacifica]
MNGALGAADLPALAAALRPTAELSSPGLFIRGKC